MSLIKISYQGVLIPDIITYNSIVSNSNYSDKKRQSTMGNIMKKFLILKVLLALSLNASAATIINGLNIDQRWNCKVQKVYNKPEDFSGKKINIRIGTRLMVDLDDEMTNPSIRDLAMDMPFQVGKYKEWFYQELKRAPKNYEKQCKGPCIIYSTSRGGRWVFQPQKDKSMIAFFDLARHPDFKTGARSMGFKCTKTSR